jgi:hypothetical protein
MSDKAALGTRDIGDSGLRVVAIIALLFGYGEQPLLDGQLFSHAVVGIFCGLVAVGCGIGSLRSDSQSRTVGMSLAGLGLLLAAWCLISLPSAYRFQEQFNNRRREYREQMEKERTQPSDVFRWPLTV